MDDFFKLVSVVPYAVPEVAFPIDEWVVVIPYTGSCFVLFFFVLPQNSKHTRPQHDEDAKTSEAYCGTMVP